MVRDITRTTIYRIRHKGYKLLALQEYVFYYRILFEVAFVLKNISKTSPLCKNSAQLRTGSCHRLLGLLDAVDSVVHGQLVGLAFGDGGGFGCLDFPGSLDCPSF